MTFNECEICCCSTAKQYVTFSDKISHRPTQNWRINHHNFSYLLIWICTSTIVIAVTSDASSEISRSKYIILIVIFYTCRSHWNKSITVVKLNSDNGRVLNKYLCWNIYDDPSYALSILLLVLSMIQSSNVHS